MWRSLSVHATCLQWPHYCVRRAARSALPTVLAKRMASAATRRLTFEELQETTNMERYKRGVTFWVLLLVSVALPTSLLATKQLYQAKILNAAGQGRGSSVISVRAGSYEYVARSSGLPNQVV